MYNDFYNLKMIIKSFYFLNDLLSQAHSDCAYVCTVLTMEICLIRAFCTGFLCVIESLYLIKNTQKTHNKDASITQTRTHASVLKRVQPLCIVHRLRVHN